MYHFHELLPFPFPLIVDERSLSFRPSLQCGELRDELKRVKRQLRTQQDGRGESHGNECADAVRD